MCLFVHMTVFWFCPARLGLGQFGLARSFLGILNGVPHSNAAIVNRLLVFLYFFLLLFVQFPLSPMVRHHVVTMWRARQVKADKD